MASVTETHQNGLTLPILHHLRGATSSAEFKHRFVITGGPGVGKTSIIKSLIALGYDVVHEAATDVIRGALDSGIEQPWATLPDFNDQILRTQNAREKAVEHLKLVFLDRSMIDTITYALIPMSGTESLKIMAQTVQAAIDAHFYQTTVFFIDNLNGCVNDEIRHENMDELRRIEGHLERNYSALGYRVVHIKPDTVENRTKDLLSYVNAISK